MKTATIPALLFLACSIALADDPRLGWVAGTLEPVEAMIGGETTGFRLGEFDVEGDKAVLGPLTGKRVAILGEQTTKEWVERGPKPLLRVREIVGLDKPERDLTLVGKVEVTGDPKAPAYVAMFLTDDRKDGDPSAHFAVTKVREDGTYELVVPGILGREGWSYGLHAWVDVDANGLCNEGDRPGWPQFAADDPKHISYSDGMWMGNGFAPVDYRSPHTHDFHIGE